MKLEHRFYKLSSSQKRIYFFSIGFLLITLFLFFGIIAYRYQFYSLFLFFPLLLSFAAPFIDVPMGVQQKKLDYLSPLCLLEPQKEKLILHGGTLFDYLFVLHKKIPVEKRKKIILQNFAEGLLYLIETEKENKNIEATTYILNERIAKKMGFSIHPANPVQKLILCYNYLLLLATKSYAAGQLSFPKLSATKTYTSDINSLKKNKDFLKRFVRI